jgi:hypothetical protein
LPFDFLGSSGWGDREVMTAAADASDTLRPVAKAGDLGASEVTQAGKLILVLLFSSSLSCSQTGVTQLTLQV